MNPTTRAVIAPYLNSRVKLEIIVLMRREIFRRLLGCGLDGHAVPLIFGGDCVRAAP